MVLRSLGRGRPLNAPAARPLGPYFFDAGCGSDSQCLIPHRLLVARNDEMNTQLVEPPFPHQLWSSLRDRAYPSVPIFLPLTLNVRYRTDSWWHAMMR